MGTNVFLKILFLYNFRCQEQFIFKRHDEFPFSKLLTVEKTSDFSIEGFYNNVSELPYTDNFIGNLLF